MNVIRNYRAMDSALPQLALGIVFAVTVIFGATAPASASDEQTAVNQAANETGEAAKQVLGAADELTQQVDGLRTSVDAFLERVRVA